MVTTEHLKRKAREDRGGHPRAEAVSAQVADPERRPENPDRRKA